MTRLSDEDLAAMTGAERAALLARLSALATPELSDPAGERRRHRFVLLATLASAALVPWVALLALTLPRSYVAARWWQTWVGFDIALIVCLLATAWCAWRRRQLLIIASVVTGTLILCDAWFDVMTANGTEDFALSATSALLIELPIATGLLALAYRLVRRTMRIARARTGGSGPDLPLYRVPLFGVIPPALPDGRAPRRT
jgi:hypothetical protein